MKNLVQLQKDRDAVRAELQAKVRMNQFDAEFDLRSEFLKRKDQEFMRLVRSENAQLSKFGRLV